MPVELDSGTIDKKVFYWTSGDKHLWGGGVLDLGSDGGVWPNTPHPVPCRIKMAQKYTLSHKNLPKSIVSREI